jgi:chromosome segregation ATPase
MTTPQRAQKPTERLPTLLEQALSALQAAEEAEVALGQQEDRAYPRWAESEQRLTDAKAELSAALTHEAVTAARQKLAAAHSERDALQTLADNLSRQREEAQRAVRAKREEVEDLRDRAARLQRLVQAQRREAQHWRWKIQEAEDDRAHRQRLLEGVEGEIARLERELAEIGQ